MNKSCCRDTLCHVVVVVAVAVAVAIDFWGGHDRLDCRYLDNFSRDRHGMTAFSL